MKTLTVEEYRKLYSENGMGDGSHETDLTVTDEELQRRFDFIRDALLRFYINEYEDTGINIHNLIDDLRSIPVGYTNLEDPEDTYDGGVHEANCVLDLATLSFVNLMDDIVVSIDEMENLETIRDCLELCTWDGFVEFIYEYASWN